MKQIDKMLKDLRKQKEQRDKPLSSLEILCNGLSDGTIPWGSERFNQLLNEHLRGIGEADGQDKNQT